MRINIDVQNEIPYQIVALAYKRALLEKHSKEIISKSKKYKMILKVGKKIKKINLIYNE